MFVSLTLFRLLIRCSVFYVTLLRLLLLSSVFSTSFMRATVPHRASVVRCLASLLSVTVTLSLLLIFLCSFFFLQIASLFFILALFVLCFYPSFNFLLYIFFCFFFMLFILFTFSDASFYSGALFTAIRYQFQFLCFCVILVSVSSLCLFVACVLFWFQSWHPPNNILWVGEAHRRIP